MENFCMFNHSMKLVLSAILSSVAFMVYSAKEEVFCPFGATNIVLTMGDVTKQPVDAIVNAAKPSLEGGAGIDGAIHTAAGPNLKKHCIGLKEIKPGERCPVGYARMTPAFNLTETVGIKYVIHTVGPHGANPSRDKLLSDAYRNIFICLLERSDIQSLAIPSISTGIYGFPIEDAAPIAIIEVLKFFEQSF